MITCIVIDDEQDAIDYLERFIGKIPDLTLVKTFLDSQLALAFLFKEQVDLIFLDGNMPKLNGIELIQSLAKPPQVVFCTGSDAFAFATYDVHVTDCLGKPISFERFSRALHYVRQALYPSHLIIPEMVNQEEDYRYFPLKGRNKFQKVLYHEIEYAESKGNYAEIHTVSGKVATKETLKQLEDRLPPGFMRVHKGFIIANKMINRVERHRVYLNDKHYVTIGEKYRPAVYEFIKKRM